MNYDKIKRTGILFLLGIGAITSLSCNDNDNGNYPERVPTRLSVMPLPERVDYKESVVSLPQNVTVSQNIPASTSQLLKSTLEEKLSLSVSDASNDRAFIRVKQEADLAKEAYRLTVTKEGACVYYSTETGLLWGIQTLRQALEQANFFTSGSAKYLPMVDIKDAPKYDWRGFHIDVVRHMFTVDYLKKVIDCLSFYKINKLHLHLTDDQGWRIEIKKYPKLTEIGSKREKTLVDYYYVNYPQVFDGKEHGGYYTQEQIKDVVAYAASKYINVVPEIEMPGHALAALAAYPELSCDSTQTYKVSPTWGVFEQVFCPSETTFKFFEGVMDEVIELFPSEYIHIGGDECPKTAWKNSAFCQQLIRQLGLKDDTTPSKTDGIKHSKEDKLQSYFVTRMEKYLNGKGRNIIGWDEILEGGLAPNATVMSWRGVEGGMNAAKAGHNAIMTPNPYVYLDYYQEEPEIAPHYLQH